MEKEQIRILEDIFQAITVSENPDRSLDIIVSMVADRFAVDVCSVYVYDPSENSLVLRATVGLNRDAVGAIKMDVMEGLTGLAIETMAPVFITDPQAHPRFKYYQGSGEEIYQTFLGLPLIYHQKIIGVLVIQTIEPNGIQETDIPVFLNIASQISATVAYARLKENRVRLNADDKYPGVGNTDIANQTNLKPNHLRGTPVSDLVATGYAHYLPENIDFDQVRNRRVDDSAGEIKRLEKAFYQSAVQIKHSLDQAQDISDQESAIIEAHLMFLKDKSLRGKIIAKIEDGHCAEYALRKVILEYVDMFKAIDDAYLSERSEDMMNIGHRILRNLLGVANDPHQAFLKDTIVIAAELSPVDLLAIRQPNLKGIVLAKGGRTSHTVILSKSFEIPIVIGVDGLLETVHENDYLIVDGASGLVYANPSSEITAEYEKRKDEAEKAGKKLSALKDLPAITTCGFSVRLGANIGLLSDIALAQKYGADHIGLYRTEFPFLLRKTFPTEEEQVDLYTRAIQKAGGLPVTIRTFDVGGDKFLPYLHYPREDNPFLGWRSIRISLELEDVFRTQIRAILRAAAKGSTKMLFPMITSVEEIRRVVELVDEEKETLRKNGVAFEKDVPLGIMVEVPAAVTILDRLLRYIDFVSIGTNDLIQYLLAVDRNNRKVADRYNILHPAVISTIYSIISVCRQFEKPVSICGEAASQLSCILLFIGMGADQISMVPSSIPAAKKFIRGITRSSAEDILLMVLEMEDADSIAQCLRQHLV
ncbi:MAG: phosphoenolpyruvate--protein phosphotransferase [Deltaproteobacteria bacterium]|nr:phosphoenolpyruvate--protein phosphotransferase [Deltaproteobacteria bacterium]